MCVERYVLFAGERIGDAPERDVLTDVTRLAMGAVNGENQNHRSGEAG